MAGAAPLGRRYTAGEAAAMERQGYEMAEVTDIRDSEPMYVVAGYRTPELQEPRNDQPGLKW